MEFNSRLSSCLSSFHRNKNASKSRLTQVILSLGAISAVGFAMMPDAAQAISIGRYRLGNHPDGSVATPFYGLRLDGLLTGDTRDVYTFDFRNVFLDYDGTDVKISGKVFGGLDTGAGYSSDQSGVWDLRFRYKNVTATGDGLVANRGNGFIQSKDFAEDRGKFRLKSFRGTHDNAFSIATGHRGVSGLSGFGWLNHFPTDGGSGGGRDSHIYSSDYLFTVEKVPEPSTILATIFAAGGAQLINRKRKKAAQKAAKQA